MVLLLGPALGQLAAQEPEQKTGSTQSRRPESQLTRDSVAPLHPATDQNERRSQQLRALQGMVVLTVVLLGFLLILMVLSLRWTRQRFLRDKEKGARQTKLEDLWLTVKAEKLPEVDIERLMSQDDAHEKPSEGEDNKS